jgi:DNA-binding transcriptional LysR family regulator
LNIRQVEILVAVLKSGMTPRAAGRLGITQPAVNRSIADVEQVICAKRGSPAAPCARLTQ